MTDREQKIREIREILGEMLGEIETEHRDFHADTCDKYAIRLSDLMDAEIAERDKEWGEWIKKGRFNHKYLIDDTDLEARLKELEAKPQSKGE